MSEAIKCEIENEGYRITSDSTNISIWKDDKQYSMYLIGKDELLSNGTFSRLPVYERWIAYLKMYLKERGLDE